MKLSSCIHQLRTPVSLALAVVALLQSATLRADSDSFQGAIGPHHVNLNPSPVRQRLPDVNANLANAPAVRPQRLIAVTTGMNYWNGEQWTPSDPSFETGRNGFTARHLQHKVQLPPDINSSLTIVSPDGLTIESTPVAIALYDAASGVSAIIANVTNSTGVLVNNQTVVYPDAFVGACADIVYSVDRGSFSQDVLLTGFLNPADYGFPTNTTRIQIITELYDLPQPDVIVRPLRVERNQGIRRNMATPDLVDNVLGFGELVFATGRASRMVSGALSSEPSTTVAKEIFTTSKGRKFLIESVVYADIWQQLASLPPCTGKPSQGAFRQGKQPTALYAAIPSPGRATQAKAPPRQRSSTLAMTDYPHRAGVVIDYVATIGGTLGSSTLFQGDTTYFISNSVTCNSSVVIEGGAVFKFSTNASAAYIKVNSSLTCKTDMYRPAVFTAVDDDSVGTSLSGYTTNYTGVINPKGYANPALWVNGVTLALSNLRFSYCQEAVRFDTCTGNTISHSQLINCIRGLVITGCWGSGGGCYTPLVANNALIGRVGTSIKDDSANSTTLQFNHCTIDTATNLFSASASAQGNFVNCILANITSLSTGSPTLSGNNNAFYNSSTLGTQIYTCSSSPFQTVGNASYYLSPNCGLFGIGVTNALQPDLAKRTTYPPVVFNGAPTVLSANLVLNPEVPRDTGTPTLGYHYDPIDFAFGSIYVSNATITVSPGTAIACFGGTNAAPYGIAVAQSGSLLCQGTPTNRCQMFSFNTVHEPSATNWVPLRTYGLLQANWSGLPNADIIQCRFVNWSILAQDCPHYGDWGSAYQQVPNFQDCEFRGGSIFAETFGANMTNCLLDRVNSYIWDASLLLGLAPATNCIRNCTFHGGSVDFYMGLTNCVVRDNLFDKTTIFDEGSVTYLGGYNGYITNCNVLTITNNNITLASSPIYLLSSIGSYYLPTNSPLVNAGSATADQVGMYHYTTSTNQVKETNSTVDCGYHYVALGTNAAPADYTADGLPDYIANSTGDGNTNNGFSNWMVSSTAGDGVSDYIKWLQGRNPRAASTSLDITGILGLTVYTPLQ